MDLRRLTKTIFRDSLLASQLAKLINDYWRLLRSNGVEEVKIMNFCGTHEYTSTHYGIRNILPQGVSLVAGPGCPVCITPSYYVETAVELALEGFTAYTYGDAYRLPAVREVKGCRSLSDARMAGADVRVVYSFLDAVRDAASHGKPAVFLAVGFETTCPAYASAIASEMVPSNLTLISAGRLTPPAARYAVERVGTVSGVIAPGHVSTITGAGVWRFLPEEYGIPTVVTGFEPVDVLIAVATILKQLAENKPGLVVEYSRTVTMDGNQRAKKFLSQVFDVVDSAWRGIGFIEKSGYSLRKQFEQYDVVKTFGLREPGKDDWKNDLMPGCICGQVILGAAKPTDCPLFMKRCTPGTPYGPCMVSAEGACSIWARLGGRERLVEVV
ncbi:hydrogenase expression/formation protein HypD [Candidatus Caldarchaeum subterraneum]|uniref:Hydrogenase expression/formation protein HypD n=1 Tax=Caldiarchaeum subterraneum TaxID=311458 RepID=E6N726_CALS0|nr:hydrogenase expression/formation protein HypD [Candidatus Caldarchaeum subterraneum]BAJ50878.1 hydrogenase expression/formation protein HypD [Candidatus Caldarchaeum subterraneum]